MSALIPALKNEHTKRVLRATGIRPPAARHGPTAHYRMPALEAAGGYLVLGRYRGPQIPQREWEDLSYTTYASDPATFFAPVASATGAMELRGFWEYGQADLEGAWTQNAAKCPALVGWIESIGARFGRVQLLRMSPNTLRECRWGLHLDDNNRGNPESNGWIVRVWLELTDDPASVLVVRPAEFDRKAEARIPLPRYQQVVLDSEALYHGGYTPGRRRGTRPSSASKAAPPWSTGSAASSLYRQTPRPVRDHQAGHCQRPHVSGQIRRPPAGFSHPP